jgi:hypothetical protein
LGEVKWSPRPVTMARLEKETRALTEKPAPNLPKALADLPAIRVLFFPILEAGLPKQCRGVRIVDGARLLPSPK